MAIEPVRGRRRRRRKPVASAVPNRVENDAKLTVLPQIFACRPVAYCIKSSKLHYLYNLTTRRSPNRSNNKKERSKSLLRFKMERCPPLEKDDR